jgi:hypothetical protein
MDLSAMASRSNAFETGFERPSLDNPLLFSRYADEIALRLGHLYPEHAGYRIKVSKEEKDARKRKWEVELLKGWFTGAKVVIKPLEPTPHRVWVKVEWYSRLLNAMWIGFAALLIPILIVSFFAFAFMTRLGFALILTLIVMVVFAIPAGLISQLVARTLAAIFGNEFDSAARIALAGKIAQFPLPQAKPSRM